MTITPMTIVWVVLVIAGLAVLAVTISRQMKAGKDVGVPASMRMETHDMPAEGSDASVLEDQQHAHETLERKPEEFVDIHRTHGA